MIDLTPKSKLARIVVNIGIAVLNILLFGWLFQGLLISWKRSPGKVFSTGLWYMIVFAGIFLVLIFFIFLLGSIKRYFHNRRFRKKRDIINYFKKK